MRLYWVCCIKEPGAIKPAKTLAKIALPFSIFAPFVREIPRLPLDYTKSPRLAVALTLRVTLSTKLSGIAVQAPPEQIVTTVSAIQTLTTASLPHALCVCWLQGFGKRSTSQRAVYPPSMTNSVPVTNLASSLAKYTAP